MIGWSSIVSVCVCADDMLDWSIIDAIAVTYTVSHSFSAAERELIRFYALSYAVPRVSNTNRERKRERALNHTEKARAEIQDDPCREREGEERVFLYGVRTEGNYNVSLVRSTLPYTTMRVL